MQETTFKRRNPLWNVLKGYLRNEYKPRNLTTLQIWKLALSHSGLHWLQKLASTSQQECMINNEEEEGKGRSAKRPCKRLKFQNFFPTVVTLLSLEQWRNAIRLDEYVLSATVYFTYLLSLGMDQLAWYVYCTNSSRSRSPWRLAFSSIIQYIHYKIAVLIYSNPSSLLCYLCMDSQC